MVYTFFDKKSATAGANRPSGTSTHTGTRINSKYQHLAEEINKPIVKKGKVYSSFKENIPAVDLADMQLIIMCY